MSPDREGQSALCRALADEARLAHRLTWGLRAFTAGYAVAYLYVAIALHRLEAFYLLLTLVSMSASACQFALIEWFRVPRPLERLAAGEASAEDTAALGELWPEIRTRNGRELAALGPSVPTQAEIDALTLADAVDLVRGAQRSNWRRIGPGVTAAFVLLAAAVTAAVLLHTPETIPSG